MKLCGHCQHDTDTYPHGFDQSEAYIDENDKFVYYYDNYCMFCKKCNEKEQ